MKKIKLMADYECYPLWNLAPGEYGDIDPSELPISKELQERLLNWAKTYDAILNRDDPASSAFPTAAAEEEFKNEGNRIAEALQNQLGSAYEVVTQII